MNIINKKYKKKIRLLNPDYGVLLDPDDWHEIIKVKKGSVIAVLASEYYDEKDYITKVN